MKTTLKTITDRATGSVKIKWTVLQASQLNMADPGHCFLVEMLVFTAESKADFFNNPWEGMEGGNRVSRRGSANILLCGRQNPPALVSGHPSIPALF